MNGDLCEVILISRPNNLVHAKNLSKDEAEVVFLLSDVQKYGSMAYSTREVAEIVGRATGRIHAEIVAGNFPKPAKAYPNMELKEPGWGMSKNNGAFKWSKDDIFALHDYFLSKNRGRPRKDGRGSPAPIPTKAEIAAILNHENIMYVRTDDGEFKQVWKENRW